MQKKRRPKPPLFSSVAVLSIAFRHQLLPNAMTVLVVGAILLVLLPFFSVGTEIVITNLYVAAAATVVHTSIV